ncbi:putative ATP-dependent RNA helicase DDX4 [Manis javanica]|nr:putative ATP-dependent RNA helicase DDX4 [Manis javanica]
MGAGLAVVIGLGIVAALLAAMVLVAREQPPADDKLARFVSTVLADTEDVWRDVFRQGGAQYTDPKLVLFRGATPTAAARGSRPWDPSTALPTRRCISTWATKRSNQLGAPGDFAQAYVIAHEVGHHVQNLLGISAQVDRARGRVSKVEYNHLSVKLELQADCLAGVWANRAQSARQILEQGDVESAMNAASKIGDDALQRAGGGAVCRTASRTAPAPSASAGSAPACVPAASSPATLFRPLPSERTPTLALLRKLRRPLRGAAFSSGGCPATKKCPHCGPSYRVLRVALTQRHACPGANWRYCNAQIALGATIALSMTSSFSNLQLAESLARAVADMGYESMTPIQAQAIPVVLTGKVSWAPPRPAQARRRRSRCRCCSG